MVVPPGPRVISTETFCQQTSRLSQRRSVHSFPELGENRQGRVYGLTHLLTRAGIMKTQLRVVSKGHMLERLTNRRPRSFTRQL